MRKAEHRKTSGYDIMVTGQTNGSTVGHPFGISMTTTCAVTKRVCGAIVKLSPAEYIQVPTRATLRRLSQGSKLSMVSHRVQEPLAVCTVHITSSFARFSYSECGCDGGLEYY